ncbi:hypothetical protein [Streptomyces sp. NPDC096033]|uniref:hypothetical protein n=1 Tax=Streptomyces sp. NPDC096033 TaxID=3366071 RepID=UPI00382B8ADF
MSRPIDPAPARPTPVSTGPCVRCRRPTTRYGTGASPLCAACRQARAEWLARP